MTAMNKEKSLWVIPTNASHIPKYIALIRALEESKYSVKILCLDNILASSDRCVHQLDNYHLNYLLLGAFGYRTSRHWLGSVIQLKKLTKVVNEFYNKQHVKGIVLFSDGHIIPHYFVKAARHRSIATVLIPDGFVLPLNPAFKKSIREVLGSLARKVVYGWSGRGSSGVARILVMNETGRDAMIASGVKPETIRVVGSPEYEGLIRSREEDSPDRLKQLKNELGLPSDRRIVFYAHQHLARRGAEKKTITHMLQACRRVKACLVIKFHPRSKNEVEEYQHWASSEGMMDDEVHFFYNECLSSDLAKICDVCVTAFSTVALEALVFRRPLLILQYRARRYRFDYADRYGVAVDVEDEKDLEKVLYSLLMDENVKTAIAARFDDAIRSELGGANLDSLGRYVCEISKVLESYGEGLTY